MPQGLGPQSSLANQAVLTHRTEKECLDNAIALIEGQPVELEITDEVILCAEKWATRQLLKNMKTAPTSPTEKTYYGGAYLR
jgi:hypothetical protein